MRISVLLIIGFSIATLIIMPWLFWLRSQYKRGYSDTPIYEADVVLGGGFACGIVGWIIAGLIGIILHFLGYPIYNY